MQTNGINRDVLVNTFEGGLDLDTDARLLANNKLRDAVNIDITKRGDQFVVKDLNGETILFSFESLATKDVYILAVTNVSFLIQPTSETRPAILVFYVTSEERFIIKALYTDNGTSQTILEEDLSSQDYLLLKDSTVDLDVVGKFGYDVVYFVDNRREPRKIECVTYQTNSNVMTLTLNSEVDGDGYKRVNLNLNSSSLPADATRVYVYAYKTGGPLSYIPINPLTESKKYLNVNYSGSNIIGFNIYPEDYGDYTFQIVYHKEGSEIYRNFTIGNPYQVQISVGSFNTFLIGLRSTLDQSSPAQTDSWEFLYNGNSFVGYIDTPTVQVGLTKVYLSEIEDPLNYVPDGYYQRADTFNTFFKVQSGVITEQDINNGTVLWTVQPSSIESDVRLAADLIQEGQFDRLNNVTIHVPQSISVGGVNYTFVETVANNNIGRLKRSVSNNYTYTIEYKKDLTPVTVYSPEGVFLDAFIISVVKFGSGYNVIGRAVLSNAVSQSVSVNLRIQAVDRASQNILPPALLTLIINSGETSAEGSVYHDENFGGEVDYGPICVLDITYSGPETITINNAC